MEIERLVRCGTGELPVRSASLDLAGWVHVTNSSNFKFKLKVLVLLT